MNDEIFDYLAASTAAYAQEAAKNGDHSRALAAVAKAAYQAGYADSARAGFDTDMVAVLVAQARAEGEAAGYSAGFTDCQSGEAGHMPS